MLLAVQAQGHLKHFRPDGQERFTLSLPDGATVRDLIASSQIPWEEIGLVAVNGAQVPEERILAEGDQVLLLAPIEGG